jgi:hypothetical protein
MALADLRRGRRACTGRPVTRAAMTLHQSGPHGYRWLLGRAMPCLVVPRLAMAVLHATGSAQGTAHGPLFRTVSSGEYRNFHRAVPAHGPCGKKKRAYFFTSLQRFYI